MTRQFDLVGIYLPGILFRQWSIPLRSNGLHNCGFQNPCFWVSYDELWTPMCYSKFLGPQECWRGKLIWFHEFCHRETFRWMVSRIFYSLNMKPLLRIYFLDAVSHKNMESTITILYIYPRTTRESIYKNSSSTFRSSSSLSMLHIAAENVAAVSSRRGSVAAFVGVTWALTITCVKCTRISVMIRM